MLFAALMYFLERRGRYQDKTATSIIDAFETILNDNKDNYPKMIMSDQDSVFTSDAFEKILDKYQISLNLYI